jgi:hypothetical protein
LPGRRQPDQAIAALKQFHAKNPFQNLDLPAERRLRHVQPGSGAAKMQFLRHGDKAAHLAQFEHPAPSFSLPILGRMTAYSGQPSASLQFDPKLVSDHPHSGSLLDR